MVGYTEQGSYGNKSPAGGKFIDQWPMREAYNRIRKIHICYSSEYKCVKGVKAQYGWDAKNADTIGKCAGYTDMSLSLATGEDIVETATAFYDG